MIYSLIANQVHFINIIESRIVSHHWVTETQSHHVLLRKFALLTIIAVIFFDQIARRIDLEAQTAGLTDHRIHRPLSASYLAEKWWIAKEWAVLDAWVVCWGCWGLSNGRFRPKNRLLQLLLLLLNVVWSFCLKKCGLGQQQFWLSCLFQRILLPVLLKCGQKSFLLMRSHHQEVKFFTFYFY